MLIIERLFYFDSKAEGLFFENKIRINGFKVPKKSHRVSLSTFFNIHSYLLFICCKYFLFNEMLDEHY